MHVLWGRPVCFSLFSGGKFGQKVPSKIATSEGNLFNESLMYSPDYTDDTKSHLSLCICINFESFFDRGFYLKHRKPRGSIAIFYIWLERKAYCCCWPQMMRYARVQQCCHQRLFCPGSALVSSSATPVTLLSSLGKFIINILAGWQI